MNFKDGLLRSFPILRSIYAATLLTGLLLPAGAVHADAPPASEFAVYRLANVAPLEAKRMLEELTAGTGGMLMIIADGESNRILIRGPEAERDRAIALLEQIDEPPPAATAAEVSVAQPAPLTPQPQQTAPPSWERQSSEPVPVVDHSNGDDDSFPPRADQSRRLPNPRATHQPLSVYFFQNRPADEIIETLRRLFARRFHQQAADEFLVETSGGQFVAARLTHTAEQCLVSGPEPLARQFLDLLSQIDSPRSEPGRMLRLLPTGKVEPRVLQEVVAIWRGAHGTMHVSQTSPREGSTVEHRPRNAAYQSLGTLGTSHIERVGQQTPAPAGSDPSVPVPPGTAPPPTDPTSAEPLRHPSSNVEIQSLPDLDVIILRGLGADVEELSRIINEIERLSAETTPEIEVYQLQHAQGEAVNQLIADVLEALAGTLQGRVTITALGKPNALLLIGWGEAVEAARKLIAQLDQPVTAGSQLHVFRLEHAVAVQVQNTIEEFYAGRTGLAPQIEITADPRTNSVVVNAAPRDLNEVALLIQKLDVGKSEAVNQARVIRLKNTLAADVAATLQNAIDAARGGGAGSNAGRSAVLEMLMVDPSGRRVVTSGLLNDVQITPDPRTNSLIITGPEPSMDLLEALIQQLDETPAATAQIKVFEVVNADATETVLMLRSLFPAQPGSTSVPQLPAAEGETSLVPVRFSVDTRTNSIIATGSASDLRIIEALLARLDAEEAQQRINEVYRLRNAPALDVAIAINEFLRSERIVQRASPGRANPFQQIESEVVVVAEPVGNSLIISASPRYFKEIMDLVKQLDEQPPQVLVQVIIAEVDLEHFHELGVELGLQDSLLFDRSLLGDLITTTTTITESTPAGVITSTNQLIQAASLTPGFNFNNLPLGNSGSDKSLATAGDTAGQALSHFNLGRMNSEIGYGGLVLSASSENVSVLIRALDQSRHVEILSRPQIMTLDNQPAFIQVGQRVPRIVATSINTIGQVNTVELEDVGLILGLTPRISPEGMVVMEIDAEKSQVGPEADGIPISVSAEGEIVRSPRVDITRAQTTVSALSGQTVILGGLITKDHNSIHRSVPWLGDIPLLGALFRYDSYMNDRKELLIIMTPHVIRGPQDADYHKQVEMARMSWCTADVYEMLSPGSPPPMMSGQYDDSGVPVIYPDLTPGMEWREDGGPEFPEPADPPTPIRPHPQEPILEPSFVPTPPEPELSEPGQIGPQSGVDNVPPKMSRLRQLRYSVFAHPPESVADVDGKGSARIRSQAPLRRDREESPTR